MAVKLPDAIQNKFDKPHFQIGDVVFFSFLGQKRYGYVKHIKKTSWGIQYNVQCFTGTTYPCGIRMDEYTTSYRSGIIFFNETKELGTEELKRRYAEGKDTNVPTISGRTTIESEDDNSTVRDDVDESESHTGPGGTIDGSQHDDIVSSARINKQHKAKRTTSKNKNLDDAIEKQKNFLNGFVKKD
jgi:hypothetical protein